VIPGRVNIAEGPGVKH